MKRTVKRNNLCRSLAFTRNLLGSRKKTRRKKNKKKNVKPALQRGGNRPVQLDLMEMLGELIGDHFVSRWF